MANLRKKLEEQIIGKAMKDDSFRKQLWESPKNTFERETGISLPGSLNVTVLQEDRNNMYLILPQVHSQSGDGELTEEELALVSGGGLWGEGGQGT